MLPKEGVDDVVISGIGGKFPETNNIEELQQKLFEKANLVTEDDRRWDSGVNNTPKATGKILDENKFDAAYYGYHRKLCVSSEPMTKLSLERAFEAMVDAGVNPFENRGRRVAVISAQMNSESEILMLTHDGLIRDGFGILGHSQALMANRISFFFNFVGPSFTVTSSFTGGLCALKQAAQLIRQGNVRAALVTSCNMLWSPTVSSEYASLQEGTLTFDNKMRPFDTKANGFIRSDGIVTYFLQRRGDANRIYASIVDVDTYCMGSREAAFMSYDIGLERYLSDFYKKAGCDPSEVAYMEPEALSIKDKDTVELNCLAKVLCSQRKSPLLIGSVKSNVGHAHAGGSFMSIAKLIIAMETGIIPPTLHYETPNPNVPALVNGALKPVTENTALQGDLVGVNNISISGDAGHLLLRRHNKTKKPLPSRNIPEDGLHRLILVSSRHEVGAKAIVQKLAAMPLDTEFISLVNNVHKSNIPNHLWRSYVVTPTGMGINSEISYCDSEKQRPLWFVFSGMGSQWNKMGEELLQFPIFASAIDKCDKVLRPRGVDIRHILTTDDKTVFDNILNCFVGITAVQVGLVDLLYAVGVRPDGMIGHSAGEVCCAYADGCLTAEQTVLCAWARGRASLDGNLSKGLMAAVGMGYKDIKDKLPPSVDVACHNAADSSTISGPWDDVVQVVNKLKEGGVFVKAVSAGEKAFHSRYIKKIAPSLNKLLTEIITDPKERSSKWLSTSVRQQNWSSKEAKFASANYYTNNLINPVLFEEACTFIPNNAIVIEIAPHGLMQAILRRSLGQQNINMSLTSRTTESNLKHFVCSLGKLYINKVELDVNALYPPVQYPVSRGTPSLAPLVTWDHTETWFVEFKNILRMVAYENSEHLIKVDENCKEYKFWSGNCVENEVIMPLAQLVHYPWQLISHTKRLDWKEQAVKIENVVVTGRVPINATKQGIELSLFRGTRCFEVCSKLGSSRLRPLLTGKITVIKCPELTQEPLYTNGHTALSYSQAEFYSMLAQHGHQLGPSFQVVKTVGVKRKDCEAVLVWSGEMIVFLEALFNLFIFLNLGSKQKLVEINGFRNFIIDTAHFFKLPSGTEIRVSYNSKSNIMFCEGLWLEGLTVSHTCIKQTKAMTLNWKSVKFTPYAENISKVDEFLNVVVQLVAEHGLNSWANKVANFTTIEVKNEEENTLAYSGPLQNAITALPQVSSKMLVKDLQKAKEILKQDLQRTYLVIGEYTSLLELAESVDRGNIFYLTEVKSGSVSLRKKLQPVLTHQAQKGTLMLLTKWVDPSKLRVFELDWMAGLRQFMSHTPADQSVVVVSRQWQPRQALKTLAKECYAHQLRCVFLDKQAQQFSLTSPGVQHQLSLGLSVNVLQGQIWGSLRTVQLTGIIPENHFLPKMESSLKSLQVHCIGLNTRTFTYEPEVPSNQAVLKYIDYCGTKRNGERVLGVGQFDQNTKKLVLDKTLVWNVPSNWTTESTATVPFVYSLAYYSLVLKAKLSRGESVLVHAGMSPVGQAAIAVSLDHGANVYATVCNESELAAFLLIFPQINKLQVFVFGKTHFELELKRATKAQGVNVIINCLKGNDLNASLRSLAYFSRLIHLCDINVEDKSSIGMFPFNRFNYMYGVTLENIVNANEEDKHTLKGLVEEGMKKGVVKPLKPKIYTAEHICEALSNLQKNNIVEKTVILSPESHFKKPVGYQCNPDESYIIVGTKHALWVELAERLVRNGARKLIIASVKQNLTTNVSRKFNNFMAQHKATIVMSSITRLDNHKDAEEFVKEANKMGPVAGIFCTFMEENSAQVVNLDMASRQLGLQLKHFVCLLGGSASVCEARARLGLPACLVQSESPLLKPQAILPYLPSLLTDGNTTGQIYMVSEEGSFARQKGSGTTMQEVQQYLSVSVEELAVLGRNLPGQTAFRERVTRSLPYQLSKYKVLPVFVLPGMSGSRLEPFIRHLMMPAFCPSLPPCLPSVEESAQFTLQQVECIQPRGPVNIVAESWSGPVALAVALLLQAKDRPVSLFLLDAAPATAQERSRVVTHANYLAATLHLPNNVSQRLAELSSWEEQLQYALQNVPVQSQPEVQSVAQAVTALLTHLTALLAFQPMGTFTGEVHLLRPRSASANDYCELKKCCEKTPVVHIMEEETVEEMLENPATASKVNEHVLFTWDL